MTIIITILGMTVTTLAYYLAYQLSKHKERNRFQKEAVAHGYGTFELDDDYEGEEDRQYVFVWLSNDLATEGDSHAL